MILLQKKTDFTFLSRYRGALMGVAILWIYLYHQGPIGIPGYDQVVPIGWAGVEIFFLLSAIGLCYSLQKNGNIIQFFQRRIVRIIPTWWVIISVGAIVLHFAGSAIPNIWWKWIGWYSGLGWWLQGWMVDSAGSSFEWYIPTLLAFYITTPWLFKLNKHTIGILIGVAVVLGIIASYYGWGKSVYMSWERIPVYMLGVLIFNMINKEVEVWKLIVFAMIGFSIFIGGYMLKDQNLILSLSIRRYGMLGMLPILLYCVTLVISRVEYLNKLLFFWGSISLEIYLIHINPNVTNYIFGNIKTMYPNPLDIIITLVVIIIISYVINVLMKLILKKKRLVLI